MEIIISTISMVFGFLFLSSNLPNKSLATSSHSLNIFLVSLTKTGQTWLKSLLYCIVNRSSRYSILTTHPQSLIPTLENDLHDVLTAGTRSSSNNIFATHLPWQVLADVVDSSDCRIIYLARNPKDTLTSLWHFLKSSTMFGGSPLPLEDLAKKFCNGTVYSGPYFDHVTEYRKESLERSERVFLITYEELESDCKKHVKRLAEFLERPFVGAQDEEVLDEIVRICSFENISNYKMNKSNELFGSGFKIPTNSFFREGAVDDYKNHLTEEMIKEIDAVTGEKFHRSGFIYGI